MSLLSLLCSTGIFILFLAADPPNKSKNAEPQKPVEAVKKQAEGNSKQPFFKRRRAATETKTDDQSAPPQTEGDPRMDLSKKTKIDPLSQAEKDLAGGLARSLGEEDGDPLERAGQRMRTVEEQLGKQQATLETAELQLKVVTDLETLLKRNKKDPSKKKKNKKENEKKDQQQEEQEQQEREKQQKQQAGKSQKKDGDNPAEKARVGRATAAEMAKMREQRDLWGHLPEMERKLLNQSFKEEKLPEYRAALEKYYSKIAELAGKDKQP